MKIVANYIIKEIFYTFLGVTGILLLIALSNRFVVFLAKAALGQLPGNFIFQIISLFIPELLALLAPLGLFIAILFAQGRLHADSEMSVLFTCGIHWSTITKITMRLSSIIAFSIFILTNWIIPEITEYREKILAKGEAIGVMQTIMPGLFQTLDGGRLVFYVEDISTSKTQFSRIFIAEHFKLDNFKKSLSLITANQGSFRIKKNRNFFLVLQDGHRYTGKVGSADYTVINFKEYGREITSTAETFPYCKRIKSSIQLWHSDLSEDKAELQWRISIPFSVLVLTLLAIPLAKVKPKQGRYSKFLPAIICYIAYYNLMTIAYRSIGAGTLSAAWGMWYVHLLFLTLGGVLLAKESGRLQEFWLK